MANAAPRGETLYVRGGKNSASRTEASSRPRSAKVGRELGGQNKHERSPQRSPHRSTQLAPRGHERSPRRAPHESRGSYVSSKLSSDIGPQHSFERALPRRHSHDHLCSEDGSPTPKTGAVATDRNWRNRGEAAGGQGNKADGRHEPERKRVVHAQPAANQPKCELIRNQQTTLSIRAAQKPLVCGWWRYNAFLLLECCLVMRSASEAC